MEKPHKSSKQLHHERQEEFHEQIEKKATQKLQAKQKGDRTIWYGLGLFGIVGWSITIPTLIGIAIGIWLDMILIDAYSWTLMMMLLGLFTGCVNAWRWIQK